MNTKLLETLKKIPDQTGSYSISCAQNEHMIGNLKIC